MSGLRPRYFPAAALVGLGVFLLAYLCWQVLGWGGERHEVLIGNLAILPPTLLAAALCWQAGERCRPRRRPVWGWRLVALGIGAYAGGELLQLVFEFATDSYAFPSLADPLYLLFYPLVLVGLLQFAAEIQHSRPLRTAIDAATVALGGAALIWYLVLGPTASADTGGLSSTMVSLAYPMGDLILIVALARILTEPRLANRRPLEILAAGAIIFIAADIIYGRLVIEGTYAGGHPIDLLWILAFSLFALAAASQGAWVRALPAAEPNAYLREAKLVTLAPYAGILAVTCLLIAANWHDDFFPGLSLLVIVAVMGVLVSLRQLLARRDLLAAHDQLREAHRELALLASTDPLTGLPNQRRVEAALAKELPTCREPDRAGALLYLDIDHFKTLNDTFGHVAGDAVLREFGEVVGGRLREDDILARWGGEEFVVLLPEADTALVTQVAERIRAEVAAWPFDAIGGCGLTISIGVAFFPEDGTTCRDLLDTADQALYRAKRSGRDQVRFPESAAVQ